MRALSLRQPWAWLVVHGKKNIENRSWNTSFRGRFLIHASKGHRREDFDRAARACEVFCHHLPPFWSSEFQQGGIIGEATIVDVLPREATTDWKLEGQYGFVLEERRPLEFIPCPGLLNFWTVPDAIAARYV